MSYVGPIGTLRWHHKKLNFSNFSTTSLIFDLKVSLDSVLQDLKPMSLGVTPSGGFKDPRTNFSKFPFFKIPIFQNLRVITGFVLTYQPTKDSFVALPDPKNQFYGLFVQF